MKNSSTETRTGKHRRRERRKREVRHSDMPDFSVQGNMRKFDKKADPFYATAAWHRIRREALQRDHGMCVDCMAEFARCESVRPQPATTVHHIIPRTERPDLALTLSNLASLCEDHHAKRHPEKGSRERAEQTACRPSAGMKIVKI